MNDKTESEAIPPLSSDIANTLCDYGTTKLLYTYPSDSNVQLNNFPVGMHFRSKTEAIEKLCLKVFNATPIYGTDIEGLKTEEKLKKDLKVINEAYTDLGEMYSKIVAVSLECDPIPAKDRDDGKIEPPWEVFARIKRERDEAREQLKAERALMDRLADALRELCHTFFWKRDITEESLNKAERVLADWVIAFVHRDQYGGQLIDSDCDCAEGEYLEPIDEAPCRMEGGTQ